MSQDMKVKLTLGGDASGVTGAIDQTEGALGRLGGSASKAGSSIDNAFGVIGIRSAGQIQAEILRVNQALDSLAREAKVTGADFDRAWAAGQAQIVKLRAELSGAQPAVNQLGGGVKGLGSAFGDLAGQVGGAFAVLQAGKMFIDANSQAESFARTMTILTGSSEKAAAEMEYVRSAASRLGVDVQEAAKAYTQLVAATKGTALEGEGARKVFEAVSGAMASLGKSSAETNNALLAVNQMASKGTVQMEELKGQLGEALPGAMKAAANGAGLTVAELSKLVESGGVLAEDLLPALAKGLTTMYGVGKENNDTFVAQWARMKNAVNDFMQVIGQSGVMKVANEGIALTTFGIKGLVVGLDAGIGKTREFFGGPQWDAEKARLSLEETARRSVLLSKTLDDVSSSGSRMGTILREESNSALQLQNAFTKANTDLEKQIVNLERLAGARKAESMASVQISRLYDTEAQQLRTVATAAEAQEAAMRRIAEQTQFAVALKETELAKEKVLASERQQQVAKEVDATKAMIDRLNAEAAARGGASEALTKQIGGLEAYLRALIAEKNGMAGESEARKQKIEAIEKEIEAKKAVAEKSSQEAQAAHSATLAAQAAAEVYKDHAKQVYALRDAHQAAETAFEKTGAAYVKGLASERELTAAREAAQKALLLYRDALNDATAAAERHVVAERTAAGLQQSALQNDLYRANTILEVARQRGNEKDIAEAQIAVWRIEMEINEAQSQAARKEAEAILLVVKAKRAELEASDALTPAKKAELEVMEASAKAKQLEAEKYDLVADRMRKLSYETRGLESSFGELSSSADQAAASADRAAASYDGLASSIKGAAQAKDGFVTNTKGEIVTTGPDVAALAAKNTQTPEQAKVFEEVFNYYYQKASQAPENYSLMQGLQFGAIERAATAAAAAEAQRRTRDSTRSASASAVQSSGSAQTYKIDLTLNGNRTVFNAADQASAENLVKVLQAAQAAVS